MAEPMLAMSVGIVTSIIPSTSLCDGDCVEIRNGEASMIRIDTIKRWWWVWVVVLVFLVGTVMVMAHPRVTCARGSVSVSRSSPVVRGGTYTVKPGQASL